MCADINKSFNRELLEKGLQKIIAGSRSYNLKERMAYLEYAWSLESAVSLSPGISQAGKRHIINESLTNVFDESHPNLNILIKKISEQEGVYKKLQKKDFIFATSFSIRPFNSLKKVNFLGSQIVFSSKLPQRFDRNPVLGGVSTRIIGKLPDGYTQLRIPISSRTAAEGGEMALELADFLRGIWNLYLCKPHIRIVSTGRRWPLNKVTLGPYHTIHEPNGKLASQNFWYQPDYVGPNRLENLQNKWKELKRFERSVLSYLIKIKSNYQERIKQAIRQYTLALDNLDFNSGFIRLWSVLELLTGTEERNYDVTVKRAAFLWKDKAFAKLVLSHLRIFRNQNVHQGKEESPDIENFLLLLQRYVYRLLMFHIKFGKRFSDFGEAIQYFDLPHEKSVLLKKVKLEKMALRNWEN